MTYINNSCADVGTVNCPCPLAETGDCLICSRLAGKGKCDCDWAGLCIYNEFMQNGELLRGRRTDTPVKIRGKIWYGDDLLLLVLQAPRGLALHAAVPGSFVFLNVPGKGAFYNVPVSVMRVDVEQGRLYLLLKIISAKTKRIADEEDMLTLRGIYRNGLLGGGVKSLAEDLKTVDGAGMLNAAKTAPRKKWLLLTRGAGFAPAVNLLDWVAGRVDVKMIIDTEKIDRELISDHLQMEHGVRICFDSLAHVIDSFAEDVEDFDKVVILASDYYIRQLAKTLEVPAHKLVCSNNFHLCCGEGVCGACGHTAPDGTVSKMCKCRDADPASDWV